MRPPPPPPLQSSTLPSPSFTSTSWFYLSPSLSSSFLLNVFIPSMKIWTPHPQGAVLRVPDGLLLLGSDALPTELFGASNKLNLYRFFSRSKRKNRNSKKTPNLLHWSMCSLLTFCCFLHWFIALTSRSWLGRRRTWVTTRRWGWIPSVGLMGSTLPYCLSDWRALGPCHWEYPIALLNWIL